MICQIQNLNIEIDQKLLISNFSYNFFSEKIYFFFGHIGAGKSLLLETIAKLRTAKAGQILWSQPEKISFLFQKNSLIPWLTVAENLNLLDIESTDDAQILFNKLGIEKLLLKKADVLSGGEIQKVNFYRAILNKPDVIFADEPFNSLDIFEKKIMYQALTEYIKQSKSMVFWVSHDLIEIKNFADEVLCFDKLTTKHSQTILKENLNLEALSEFISGVLEKP